MVYWLLLPALLLLLPPAMEAQPRREDIRFSPLEPYSLLLPDEIRIESAATVAGTTLVVWGTREQVDGAAVVPALRMQIVRDGRPAGSSAIAHPPSARPSRLVRLVANGSDFNLFWNDVRTGDSGLYQQRIDLDGARAGEERKLIDGKIIDIATYPDLPGLTLVLRDKAAPVFLRADGSLDSSGIDSSLLVHAHVIAADSSTVSVEGDSVYFRSSFRNGAITHRIRLPDEAVLPATAVIGRNSDGEPVLTWLRSSPDPTTFCGPTSDAMLAYNVMQSRIVGRAGYDSPVTVDSMGACASGACHPSAGLRSASRQSRSGGYIVTVVFVTGYKCPGQNESRPHAFLCVR